MMEKQYPKDFIGEEISLEIGPYEFRNPQAALREELHRMVRKDLKNKLVLLCDFSNIKTTIDKKITVSGIVTKCEVDC